MPGGELLRTTSMFTYTAHIFILRRAPIESAPGQRAHATTRAGVRINNARSRGYTTLFIVWHG